MTKRYPLRALGLSAAIIVGAGGSLAASPAFAAKPMVATKGDAWVQTTKELKQKGAIGFGPGADGKVIVMVDASDKKATKALSNFESAHSNVELIELEDGIQPLSDRDVVGGAGYYSNSSGTAGHFESGCSFGFPGWGPNGEKAVITAGHCHSTARGTFENVGVTNPLTDFDGSEGFNPTELHKGEMFGKFAESQWGGKDNKYGPKDDPTATDIGVISQTNDKYNLKPEVTDWSTKNDGDLSLSTTKIRSVGAAQPGMALNSSGRTTGLNKGQAKTDNTYVFAVTDDPDGPGPQPPVGHRWVTGFMATNHGAPGDSGGPWFTDDGAAVGITSAGGKDANTGEEYSLATDISHGLQQTSGYKVRLFVEAPKIENVTVKPGETVSGTTEPDATPVLVDGAPENLKSEKGKFSFTAPEKAGEYKYTFVAKKGDYDISEGTTVTVTVEGSDPSPTPTDDPTPTPTDDPTSTPTDDPTSTPTDDPTSTPTDDPTSTPTDDPTSTPTDDPTSTPTDDPTSSPTDDPTSTPTATDDPSDDPAERALKIDPENIKATDFVKKDAVQILATGCTPGTEAKLEVKPRGSNVTGHTDTATVDKDGNVGFSVYGKNASTPNAYIGDYDVTVTCDGGDALKGSFTVSKTGGNDDDGKGGDNGKDKGKDLPRTGSEALSSLGVAAALVAGGAGLYVLARRRKN